MDLLCYMEKLPELVDLALPSAVTADTNSMVTSTRNWEAATVVGST